MQDWSGHALSQRFSTGVSREFEGRSKRREKILRNKKIVKIHDEHYF
jgi:hypothetical protein